MKDTRQWEFVADMNFDGFVTISDIGLWVNWIFTYPGDWVVFKLTHNSIGRFLEFSAADYGGVFSFLISLLFFAMIFFIPSMITDGISEQKEWNENQSPKEKLQARRIMSVMIFTVFSFFLLWASLQLNIFWLEIISAFMVLLSSVLFFTSNRWNKY
jgi:hypothetical protein